MKFKPIILTALALTLPLTGAKAQQWSVNTLPPGLIAWWQAEGNMLDSAGPHHGTGSAAPTYAPGRFGQAFQFNGADQSVDIPNIYADLDGWTQFTLEAWFNADNVADAPTPGPGRTIFSKVGNAADHSDYNQGYQFGWDANGTRLILKFNVPGQSWPGYATRANLATPLLTNAWYHLVGTYDHNAVKIYLNSVPLITNVIGPVTIQNSTSTLRISKDDNLNVPFAGRIDDARIYNRALTSLEVAYVFSGKPWLNLTRTNDQLTLSWFAPDDGWLLECTNALPTGSGASWPQVPPPYPTNSGMFFVTVTNAPVGGGQFFRLHKP